MRILLIFCSLLFIQQFSNAQILKKFSDKPDEYFSQLDEYMNRTKRKDCAQAYKNFEKLTDDLIISEAQLQAIINTGNKMLYRRMVAYPYFVNYFNTLSEIITSDSSKFTFDEWNKLVDTILVTTRKSKHIKFNAFLDFTNALNNKNAIYASRARIWKANANNLNIVFDNDKLKIDLDNVNLTAITNGDTLTIYDTKGIIYPLEGIWQGEKGKVTWERAGLGPNDAYCTFGKYDVDLAKSGLEIDSVKFYFNTFLQKPLSGKLTDKLVTGYKKGITSYPRFSSYEDNITIKNLAPKVDYNGGFSLYGQKTIGSGVGSKDASLKFYDANDKLVVKAFSSRFAISKTEQIKSSQATVTIYFGEDSIYHPGVALKFTLNNRKLKLTRGTGTIGKTAFFDSYHQMEMYPEIFEWSIDSTKINFKMASAKGTVSTNFESANYFDANKFLKFQALSDNNPISIVKEIAEKYGVRKILADDIAKRMNPSYTVESIRRLLYKMVEDGFIYYDQSKELVTVKEKAFTYVFANRDLIDYDVIDIESKTPGNNAVLDISTGDLELYGVSSVKASESKNVAIQPENGQITMKKNRDMVFAGKIGQVFVGRLDYFGHGFFFDYDDFKMSLEQVDSLVIQVPSETELAFDGQPKLLPLTSKIENLKGSLIIDSSNNKSSRFLYPQYPSFESLTESYVYYDDPKVEGGVYDRSNFYFKLDPFRFDSLDTFNPRAVEFEGTMISGDMLPDFRGTLHIQEDLSLGLETETPEFGYPIYGGRGRFSGDLQISNKGVKASGTLTYLSSTSTVENAMFFPDSIRASIGEFNLRKASYGGVTVPAVLTNNVAILWQPYNDEMKIRKNDGAFDFYKNKAKFNGTIILSPNGLSGDGTMKWNRGILNSKYYNFTTNDFTADSSDFQLKSKSSEKLAFKTTNVKSYINVLNDTATFTSNYKEEMTSEFPILGYKTSISDFAWDAKRELMHFQGDGESESKFVTTDTTIDQIVFHGSKAQYDVNKNTLDIDDVEFIEVADANIFPDSGEVEVRVSSGIRTFKNSVIIANRDTKYYTFYDAVTKVKTGNSYIADGSLDYINMVKDTQFLRFKNIDVKKISDTIYQTIASAEIDAKNKFEWNPSLKFEGNINLNASNKLLNFDGFAKIDTPYSTLGSDWFSFNNHIDKDSFYIDLFEPKNKNEEKLFAGMILSKDTTTMYANFLSPKKEEDDISVFTADTLLHFDNNEGIYYIGEKEKFFNDTNKLKGNYLKYNTKKGRLFGEGSIDLGLKLGAMTGVYAGNATGNLKDTTFSFRIMTGFTFLFSEELLEIMKIDFDNLSFDQDDIDYLEPYFARAVSELTNDKKTERITRKMLVDGVFEKPEDMSQFTLFFPDLKLVWNPESNSFISKGKVGVGSIGEHEINKYIDMYIEFGRRNSGGTFNMYFKLTNKDWYFFSYNNLILNVISSNVEFNNLLVAIPPKERKTKGVINKAPYIYTKCTEFEKQTFLDRILPYYRK